MADAVRHAALEEAERSRAAAASASPAAPSGGSSMKARVQKAEEVRKIADARLAQLRVADEVKRQMLADKKLIPVDVFEGMALGVANELRQMTDRQRRRVEAIEPMAGDGAAHQGAVVQRRSRGVAGVMNKDQDQWHGSRRGGGVRRKLLPNGPRRRNGRLRRGGVAVSGPRPSRYLRDCGGWSKAETRFRFGCEDEGGKDRDVGRPDLPSGSLRGRDGAVLMAATAPLSWRWPTSGTAAVREVPRGPEASPGSPGAPRQSAPQ